MRCLSFREFLALGAFPACCFIVFALCFSPRIASSEDLSDLATVDPEVRQSLIDSSDKESFLAVQADTRGRLFVGCREGLFVYVANGLGGFHPRRELYRFPDHTWIYDIAIRGHDLYLLTVSALYVLPGAVVERENLHAKRLVWGVPMGHVHQCFHGLTLGPEGDLYFALGDTLWYYGDFERPDHWGHWTFFCQPEGTHVPYTGVGGVLRCHPDGSGLQVVARGLRNSCGLVFDRDWNLFTNDNDHEQMPAQYTPGRLIHVIPHGYYNWPRGWLPSKTPDRADVLPTLFEGMGRAVPVGQAYYDDLLLPASYRNNLLVARWCIKSVTRYPLSTRGASFEVSEHHVLDGREQARPVGLCVGHGGRIYVTIAYMAQNEGSPVYRSDLVMLSSSDEAAHSYPPYDAVSAPVAKLLEELSDPNWSRRYAAHQELARRGSSVDANTYASRLQATNPSDPAYASLVWLGQLASKVPITDEPDPRLRQQFVRALLLDDKGQSRLAELAPRLLEDPAPEVRLATLSGLHSLPATNRLIAQRQIAELARSTDAYLRQSATLYIAERWPMEAVEALAQQKDAPTRLAAVLAAGFRLTLPPVNGLIDERMPLDPLRSEEAYVIQFADANLDLRDFGRVGNFTIADHWKVGGHSPEQEQLFDLLLRSLADEAESVRLQAAHFLSLLADPRSEPLVALVLAQTEETRLLATPAKGVGKVWLVGPFPDGDEGFERIHPPEESAIELSADYQVADASLTWRQSEPAMHIDFAKTVGAFDHASCYAVCRLDSGVRQRIQLLVGSNDGVRVWHNGKLVWTNDVVRGALPFQDVFSLTLEPGANELLFRVRNDSGECGLYIHYRALSEVVPRLAEKLDVASLAERLASAAQEGGGESIPEAFVQVDWPRTVREGDKTQGKKLFDAAGCGKCHSIRAEDAGGGGPSLADVRKRFTIPYLVESVLLPNKQVSPVFRATAVLTTDGRPFTGLLLGETAEKIELLLADTKRISLLKSEIEEREVKDLSPMPRSLLKTPEELRDILSYLLDPD